MRIIGIAVRIIGIAVRIIGIAVRIIGIAVRIIDVAWLASILSGTQRTNLWGALRDVARSSGGTLGVLKVA